jgi:hypothetical protein
MRKNPAKKANRRLTGELLAMARDLRASGLITKARYEKIAAQHYQGSAPVRPFQLGKVVGATASDVLVMLLRSSGTGSV